MQGSLNSMVLTPDIIDRIILLFSVFMGGLLLIMGTLLVFYGNRHRLRAKRQQLAQTVVQKAIFHDSADQNKYGFYGYKYIRDRRFRDVLIANIITARKNLTGSAFVQLKQLYEQLQLEKYALRKLLSPRWHLKAQAIQELATLQLVQYIPKLLKLINHPNEFVRVEAQTALLQLQGFDGLAFLNLVAYPMSDWQQVKLLHELHELPITADTEITKWLKSENDTVCVFAIRIIKQFHQFQVHDALISCLDHPNPRVRKETILTLKGIYTAETSKQLKEHYLDETPENQLAMMQVLQCIGTADDLDFLKANINCANNELKVAVIRAIAAIDKIELTSLERQEGNFNYPLPEIIKQVKGELS